MNGLQSMIVLGIMVVISFYAGYKVGKGDNQ